MKRTMLGLLLFYGVIGLTYLSGSCGEELPTRGIGLFFVIACVAFLLRPKAGWWMLVGLTAIFMVIPTVEVILDGFRQPEPLLYPFFFGICLLVLLDGKPARTKGVDRSADEIGNSVPR